MLFLKRSSDVFQQHYDQIMADNLRRGRAEEEARRRAERRTFYDETGTIYVPEHTRWERIKKDLHKEVGNGLNEALAALEDENHAMLNGVLGTINFNRRFGRTELTDHNSTALITHFSRYRLLDEDFEFPDLFGRGVRVPHRGICRFPPGKKGGSSTPHARSFG